MRRALLVLVVAACARHNPENVVPACTPGEQRQCACIGGDTGVQICNPMGTSLGECLGCPGGPQVDLAVVQDLSLADFLLADFSLADLSGVPERPDLTGFTRFPDMPAPDLGVEPDLAMSLPDLAAPIDLAGADLAPATPCPVVLLVLDTSGSMSGDFTGLNATHIDGAHQALDAVVDSYGLRVPFGFAHFDDSTLVCTDGIVTVIEPEKGSRATLKNAINATVAGGSTNTGDAINVFAADPNLHDAARQGSFIVLITDGAGNCETSDPSFTVTAVGNAANGAQPIKTYVIALDVAAMGAADETEMELMANAGKRPCSSGFCGGHAYYPAPDPAHLARALDLVLNDIVAGAPGGQCAGFACFPSGAPCAIGSSCCGTQGCKNLQNDPENCGSCGNSCGAGGSCVSGKCHCGSTQCAVGDQCCGGTCCSQIDMALPLCSCDTPCLLGCIATNCCSETATCTATPNLCTCVSGGFGGC